MLLRFPQAILNRMTTNSGRGGQNNPFNKPRVTLYFSLLEAVFSQKLLPFSLKQNCSFAFLLVQSS